MEGFEINEHDPNLASDSIPSLNNLCISASTECFLESALACHPMTYGHGSWGWRTDGGMGRRKKKRRDNCDVKLSTTPQHTIQQMIYNLGRAIAH